jgi:hypothetical protein
MAEQLAPFSRARPCRGRRCLPRDARAEGRLIRQRNRQKTADCMEAATILFDHLVGDGEQRRRHLDAERSRRSQVAMLRPSGWNRSPARIPIVRACGELAASAAAVVDHDPPPRIHAERADRSAGCKPDTI